jgi:hypothetical protein
MDVMWLNTAAVGMVIFVSYVYIAEKHLTLHSVWLLLL